MVCASRDVSVVIAQFDVERIPVDEPKADTPLVVDGDGVKSVAFARERVQAISQRHLQVVQGRRQVHVLQFAYRPRNQVDGQSLRLALFEQVPGSPVGK